MPDFYTPDTFSNEKYKRTGWNVILRELEIDDFNQRLIVRVCTGRKFWPLFSEVIDVKLGDKDPALTWIKLSLKSYTFPMVDRFVTELEAMLSDLYKVNISFKNIEYPNDTKTDSSQSEKADGAI